VCHDSVTDGTATANIFKLLMQTVPLGSETLTSYAAAAVHYYTGIVSTVM